MENNRSLKEKKDRLLKEAQLIAEKFPFYTVKGKLDHLYGNIYESPDGEIKYALEIVYEDTFPEHPPQFIFSDESLNIPEGTQIKSLKNWTPESNVVDIVSELSKLIKITIESKGQQVESDDTIEEDEYLIPDSGEYPDNYDQVSTDTKDYPEWNPEDFVESPTNINKEEQFESTDADIQIATEAALIQQEYAMDYINNSVGIVEVYLTITVEQTFIIQINFLNYPQRPELILNEGLASMFGDINEKLKILKNWKEKSPSHIVEIIRELESKLWFLSEVEIETKKISGSYKTEIINNIFSNLKVILLTYGFKEYTLNVDLSNYPNFPKIEYSTDLNDLIKTPVENLAVYKNWKKKDSHVVEILEEISWLVDKNSRINFEIDLLKGGMKEVKYLAELNSITAKLAGQLKTKDLTFEFDVKLPDNYPMTAPEFVLKTDLEGMEDLEKKLKKQIKEFVGSWHPFNYLIDLFNRISKAIFEVSVVSCVICHQIDCPSCKSKISILNIDYGEECQVMCPACERLYHKHCWDQTILSFGKCGFCLRPPPPHLRPK